MIRSKRPRILLIADVRGWIFERHCLMLKRYLSDQFDFTIKYDNDPYTENEYDLIYPLEWYKVKAERMQDPAKYVTGIRSHLVWTECPFGDIVRQLASHFNLVHTVSGRLYDIFAPELHNARYVSHGVDTSFFTPTTACDLSGPTMRVGWAGNRLSVGRKGFDDFIKPLAELPGVELVFCGYSDRNLSLLEMHGFYESLDAYVCASDFEGNNNSLLEAAAMARAIVTTDNGTVPEYLEDGVSALIVPRVPEAFAGAVLKLRDDPELRSRLGAAARRAVSAWDWKKRAGEFARFFEEALQRQRDPQLVTDSGRGRILLACTHFWPSVGGVEIMAENLGVKLSQRGYLVDVATWRHPHRKDHLHRGITIIPLDPDPVRDGVKLWIVQLRQLIASARYRACILIGDPLNMLITAAEDVDIPAVTRLLIQPVINRDGYSCWRDDTSFRQRLSGILRRAIPISLTKTGVDARFMKDEGLDPVHIPNAVDSVPPDGDFRKRYGIAESAFLILHVANLWRVKNHVGLLRCLGALPEPYLLVMIGYPSGDGEYEREVTAELGRHPLVRHIPGLPPEGIAAAFNAADLVVLASHGEVAPVSILEAMSHGVPWLATPECGAVTEHAGGLVLPLERFASVIGLLRQKEEIRRTLGELGRRQWSSCYCWEVLTDLWVDLVETGGIRQRWREVPVEAISTQQESVKAAILDALSDAQGGMKMDAKTEIVVPLVSVVVPTWNRPEMLKDAVRSILDQTFQDFEIIIVNDAGCDVSAIVQELDSDKVRCLSHQVNKGLAAARNTGLRTARGKYIAYLDDDDIYYPDHLQVLVDYLRSTGAKVAYTDAYRAHQTLQHGSYSVTARDLPYSNDFHYKQILVGNFIPVLCVMHEAQCIWEGGCFDEELDSHEDWDLWIRLSRKFSFHHIDKVTCEFRWRQDGTTMTSSKEIGFISTQERIYRKYHAICRQMPDVLEQQKRSLLARKKAAEGMFPVKCSIVIPVFNQVEFTARCLDALYEVTGLAAAFEVIVVDNASTDRTEAYLKEAAKVYPNLRVHRNESNILFAGACNRGAELARGEILVFLNNDTVPEAEWLDRLIAPLTERDDVGMVGAKLLYPDRTVQHGGMAFVSCGPGADGVFPVHRLRGVSEDDPRINQPEEVRIVTGACMAIGRDLYQQVGGICADYGMYYEDTDLCLKVLRAGKKIFYEPRSVVIHFEGSSSSRDAAVALDAKAREVFLEKWGDDLPSLAEAVVSARPTTVLWFRPESTWDNMVAASILPELKARYPDARITAVCDEYVADLCKRSPFIDAIFTFDKGRASRDVTYRETVCRRLQGEQGDIAVHSANLTEPVQEYLVTRSGARERIALQGGQDG